MTKPESVLKEAVYAGQREAHGGKVAHAWIINGNESWFSKPSGGVIGGVYLLRFTPDLTKVFSRDVTYQRYRIDDNAKIVEWELEDREAKDRRLTASAERKHKADKRTTAALHELDDVIHNLTSPTHARALANMTMAYIIDEYWRSRG